MSGVRLTFEAQTDFAALRNARGQFKNRAITNEEVRSLNHRLAKELQALVVEELGKTIERRGVSTGRLARVTASPENIYLAGNILSSASWGVGVASFLDKSEAKYWRTIEDGSAAVWRHPFVGMKIWPWANTLGKVSDSKHLAWGGTIRRQAESGHRSSYQAGPPWGVAPNEGKFRGIRPWWGARIMNNWTLRGKTFKQLGYGPLTVQHEIQPHHYYERAYDLIAPEVFRSYDKLIDRLDL